MRPATVTVVLAPLLVLTGGAARAYDAASLVSGTPGDPPVLRAVPHDRGKYVGFAEALATFLEQSRMLPAR